MQPKLIVFDLDGTLIEFPREYLFRETERILLEFVHPPVCRTELERSFSAFDYFGFIDQAKRQIFSDFFEKAFDWDNFPAPSVLEEVSETLARLQSAGFDLAIATSRYCSAEELREELSETGLLGYFSLLTTRERQEQHWTDKTSQLTRVLQSFGVEPSAAMMVGDIPSDIYSAKKVGIGTAVAVLSGGISETVLKLAEPDILLTHMKELAGVLLGNFGR